MPAADGVPVRGETGANFQLHEIVLDIHFAAARWLCENAL